MKQVNPEFGRKLDAGAVADVLGLSLSAIDERFPVEEVSTGLRIHRRKIYHGCHG